MDALKTLSGNFSSLDSGGLERYAIGLLGEYLSKSWVATLKQEYREVINLEGVVFSLPGDSIGDAQALTRLVYDSVSFSKYSRTLLT